MELAPFVRKAQGKTYEQSGNREEVADGSLHSNDGKAAKW